MPDTSPYRLPAAPRGTGRRRGLTRRTALVAAPVLGLGLLTACDLPGIDDGEPDDAGATPAADADTEADLAVVAEAIDAVEPVAAQVAAAVAAAPDLAPGLSGLADLHTAHLDDLRAADAGSAPSSSPSTTATGVPPAAATDPATLLAAVRQAEVGLAAALADLAVDCRSGALARLLAMMAAGIDQQLAAGAGAA
ncbi:hypothetical protein [Nocardioides alkalitolerans]|uniref:hypothetical protein n=1 Tax=Nocardioides alkalitolerans TaxID=281714 RepID=UPI000416B80E|nr:hypothetical protein [Nocardioides alkalitolerans]